MYNKTNKKAIERFIAVEKWRFVACLFALWFDFHTLDWQQKTKWKNSSYNKPKQNAMKICTTTNKTKLVGWYEKNCMDSQNDKSPKISNRA